ncbi:hypothetical protein PIN31009_01407 [Pandoraea iniqua]|uniref:Uncharacterized protein n=2 Tax=Pandoraea iniqua TaxID=2508288 RepID=A0A5E4TFC8_9BURK|nr:hypothetical protein PIN31009_01407 [Pandoraea iniqua]VVD90964.1 hypothetical protein PIN31115_01593 [Pandoraea iniqua]
MVALTVMLGACANTGSGAGDSSSSARSGSGTGKVEAYGVIDGGVTIVK